MIVCWLTLHILSASPVVKTVFMVVWVPFCEIKDKVPPPDHSGLDRKQKTTLDRPPCKSCSQRELNHHRAFPRSPRRSHQPLGNTPLLKSTKPLEITNITDPTNCITPSSLVNANDLLLASWLLRPASTA